MKLSFEIVADVSSFDLTYGMVKAVAKYMASNVAMLAQKDHYMEFGITSDVEMRDIVADAVKTHLGNMDIKISLESGSSDAYGPCDLVNCLYECVMDSKLVDKLYFPPRLFEKLKNGEGKKELAYVLEFYFAHVASKAIIGGLRSKLTQDKLGGIDVDILSIDRSLGDSDVSDDF